MTRKSRTTGGRLECDARQARQFDQETWSALDLLARDSMRDFQELAEEAFADLLKKHGRPVDLHTALRQSVGDVEKRPAAPSVTKGR